MDIKGMSVFKVGIAIIYILLILSPFLLVGILGLPSGFAGVNPEVINGLLVGSSILFGFSVLPLPKKELHVVLHSFLLVDTWLLAVCGIEVFNSALGRSSGLSALLFAVASFNGNLITALYRHTLLTQ